MLIGCNIPVWYTLRISGSIKGISLFAVSISDTKPIQYGEIMVGEDNFGLWLSRRRKSLGLLKNN
jgi:hypothetical protein